MSMSRISDVSNSARLLTLAAYASFVPIGIVTVLLGPTLPTLSARWSLNFSQAGALFTAQYLASTCAVGVSGWLVTRWGFRFAMKAGLGLATVGTAFILAGPEALGIACIAAYGAGLGLAVPAANLLVAEVNPRRRSAALNILNFCWSAGAVACPFLVALAAKIHHIGLLLGLVAGFMFLVLVGIAAMPSSVVEPRASVEPGTSLFRIEWKHPALLALAILFFLYVGTENAFGGWVATFSKSLGNMSPAMSLMTPSFFYASLMLGRWIAPVILKSVDEVRLVQVGLLLASAGTTGLMLSHGLTGVLISACGAGFGLSSVYPITIAMLSREFGSSASRVGSVMFTLSNVGGGLLPWIVGVWSNRFGSLKAGLLVPLIGSVLMAMLYLREWTPEPSNP
jgi:fucose permease